MSPDDPDERQPASSSDGNDAELERLPDNVGQSGRWRRKEHGERSRYGKEESTHSTEQGRPPAGKTNLPTDK